VTSLQSRVAEFLEVAPPARLISVGESATKAILLTLASSGALKKGQPELLDACIASNAVAADEAEQEDEKHHFFRESHLLSEIKAEISTR
jgi:hypothetical protein